MRSLCGACGVGVIRKGNGEWEAATIKRWKETKKKNRGRSMCPILAKSQFLETTSLTRSDKFITLPLNHLTLQEGCCWCCTVFAPTITYTLEPTLRFQIAPKIHWTTKAALLYAFNLNLFACLPASPQDCQHSFLICFLTSSSTC